MNDDPLLEADYEERWTQFWAHHCANPDGSLRIDDIKRELSDYYFVLSQVPKVYMAVTNDRLSKPNYYANVVIQEAEEANQEWHREEMNEFANLILDHLEGEDPSVLETVTEAILSYHPSFKREPIASVTDTSDTNL